MMNKIKILSFVLVFSVLVTSLFSVSFASASSYLISDDIFSFLLMSYNSSGSSTTLYSGSNTIYNGVDGGYTVDYNTSRYIPYSTINLRSVHQHNFSIPSGQTMDGGVEYRISIDNFLFYVRYHDADNDRYYDETSLSIDTFRFRFYYTDGSFVDVVPDDYTFDWDESSYSYSFSASLKPTKNVSSFYLSFTFRLNDFSTDYRYDMQNPYYSINYGSAQGEEFYYIVEPVEEYGSFLDRIIGTLSNLFNNLRDGFTNVLSGLDDIIDTITSKLSSLGTSILNKLTTVQRGIVNAVSNVVSGIGTLKDNLIDKLTTVQSGIVNAVSNVVSGIGTLKDSLLDRLTSVKDGIVDKLENISSFFGFNASGRSELDDLNSGLNDSSSSMEEAADDLNGISSEVIDIDSVVSDGLQSDGSNFLNSFTEIFNIPIVTRGFITVFSVALIGYVLYGKRG